MTGVFLLIAFVILSNAAIPEKDLVTERYDEIDWMRFTPQPPEPVQPEEVSREKNPEKEILPEQPVIQRIDLDQVLDKLDLTEVKLTTQDFQTTGKSPNQSAPAHMDINNLDPAALSSDFNLTMDNSSPLANVARRGRGRRSGGEQRVEVKERETTGGGSGSVAPSTKADLKGPTARKNRGNDQQTEIPAMADLDSDFENFSPIYRPLIEWMKKNPAVLPPVVKRFMSYQNGDLTSRVSFAIDNRQFDMMLLCVEATYEVRIVLVEKREVTYLIDQGFRKKSNFLRVGSVDRLPTKAILKFSTNLRPANNSRTREFYQIFISWWDSVKHEVEQ